MYQLSFSDHGKPEHLKTSSLVESFRACARFLHFPIVDLLKIEHLETLEAKSRVSFSAGERTVTIHKVQ